MSRPFRDLDDWLDWTAAVVVEPRLEMMWFAGNERRRT